MTGYLSLYDHSKEVWAAIDGKGAKIEMNPSPPRLKKQRSICICQAAAWRMQGSFFHGEEPFCSGLLAYPRNARQICQ